MIKNQLIQFKQQRVKQSVYDLKVGQQARIDVDLTYYLEEANNGKAQEQEAKTQTDEFCAKPPTPRYVPKKTGRDEATQIEDYDLFDYDAEV